VHEFVCHGDKLAAVPAGVVDEIRAREDDAGLIILHQDSHFSRGEKVEIVSGVFFDRLGLFECRSDKDRVVVLLSLLGRPVRVTVPIDAIRRYN
jgi:transcription antitermination factor NusG